MPREALQALAGDVRRLLAAGGKVAGGDEGLRKRGQTLGELGKKVPALATIGQAADRVVKAKAAEAPAALLDLMVVVRQAQAGLAGVGDMGKPEAAPADGPWAAGAPCREVHPIAEGLADTGTGKIAALAEGLERGLFDDLRLVESLAPALTRPVALFLVEFGPEAKGAASALKAALFTGKKESQVQAARVLWQLGIVSAAPALVATLKDHEPAVRAAAAEALGRLKTDDKEALAALEKAVEDRAGEVRAEAIVALGRVGEPARGAVPALVKVLQSGKEDERRRAARALGDIGPAAKAAVPALVETLGDERESLRINAALALGMMGEAAKAAVAKLAERLKDEAVPVRAHAAAALGRMGAAAGAAVAALVAAAGDEQAAVRCQTVQALGMIAPKDKEGQAALKKAQEDADPYVRARAAAALGTPAKSGKAKPAAKKKGKA